MSRIEATPARHPRTRWILGTVVMVVLWLIACGTVRAEGVSHPGFRLAVELSDTPRAGAGISVLLRFSPAPGRAVAPPVRALRLDGGIGSVDLHGVPTCRPTTRSPRTSGCTAPPIGGGRGYGYQSPTAEGDKPLKLRGTIRLYSGGQHGGVSRLYAWASFPTAGPGEAGRSYVVPITFRREGLDRGELRAVFPRPEGNLFSIIESRLAIYKSVGVGRQSIPLTSVHCPVGPGAEVQAEASFWGPATPVDATSSPTCRS